MRFRVFVRAIRKRERLPVVLVLAFFLLAACGVGDSGVELLTVKKKGSGRGTVTAVSDKNKIPGAQEGGVDCGSRCQDWYYEGDALTLTATPDSNSVFSGWSGDCAGTVSPVSLTLGDHGNICTATFTSTTLASNVVITWVEDGDIFVARSTDDGVTFGDPVNRSNSGAAFAPQLVVEGETVLIVWEEDNGTIRDIFLTHSGDRGVTFGNPVKLSNSGAASAPKLAIEGSTVMAAWVEDVSGLGEIFTARSIDGGVTFDPPVNQSNTLGDSSIPDLVIEGGIVMLTWADDTPGSYDIFMMRSTDGGGTFPPGLFHNSAGVESFNPRSGISGHTVLITWEEGDDIVAARFTDDGATFDAFRMISNSNVAAFSPQIAVEGNDVLIAWEEEDGDVFTAHSTDGGETFGGPLNLSNSGTASFSTLTPGEGTFLMTWMDDTSGASDIFAAYSTDAGARFGVPINVSNTAGESSSPHAALSSSTLFITWGDDTTGSNDIYLARSTDGGTDFGVAVRVFDSDGHAANPQMGLIP